MECTHALTRLVVWIYITIFFSHQISAKFFPLEGDTLERIVSVRTTGGKLRGKIVTAPGGSKLVAEFLGVPFAEPPINELRFQDPVPKKKWAGVYNAFDYGDSCMQIKDTKFPDFEGAEMWNAPKPPSEDCLYLNVWAPYPSPRNASVLVWIFGGGFFSGTTSLWVYDGKTLAAHTGVIVVSMNYRVGALGYLASGDGKIKGNFGMLDQIVALKWIQDNIHQFGGDPHSVTLFGESAGSSSVGLHLMSHYGDGLFHRVIMESGSPDAHWAYMTRTQAKLRYNLFLDGVNCPDDPQLLKCLLRVPADQILNYEWVTEGLLAFPWLPTVDGDYLMDDPDKLMAKGHIRKVDTLIGVNKDEGTYFIVYDMPGYEKDNESYQTHDQFLHHVDRAIRDLSPHVQQMVKYLYTDWKNPYSPISNRDALDDVVGDRSFICPSLHFAEVMAEADKNVYVYQFLHRSSNELWPDWMGTIHGAEIPYVFGMPMNYSRGFNADEKLLAHRVMTYWANFAKYGDPNGNDVTLPQWPRHRKFWHEYLEISTGENMVSKRALRANYCAFWNILVPSLERIRCHPLIGCNHTPKIEY